MPRVKILDTASGDVSAQEANSRPVVVDNKWLKGQAMLIQETGDSAHFELQFQFEFKDTIRNELWFSLEIDTMHPGRLTRFAWNAATTVIEALNRRYLKMHWKWSWGDDRMRAFLQLRFRDSYTLLSHVVGDRLPVLGQWRGDDDLPGILPNTREDVLFRPGQVFTASIWTAYADTYKWQLVGLPTVGSISLKPHIDTRSLHFCIRMDKGDAVQEKLLDLEVVNEVIHPQCFVQSKDKVKLAHSGVRSEEPVARDVYNLLMSFCIFSLVLVMAHRCWGYTILAFLVSMVVWRWVATAPKLQLPSEVPGSIVHIGGAPPLECQLHRFRQKDWQNDGYGKVKLRKHAASGCVRLAFVPDGSRFAAEIFDVRGPACSSPGRDNNVMLSTSTSVELSLTFPTSDQAFMFQAKLQELSGDVVSSSKPTDRSLVSTKTSDRSSNGRSRNPSSGCCRCFL